MNTSKNAIRDRLTMRIPAWTWALLAAGIVSPSAVAQIQKAGDLLVDVDGTSLNAGAVANIKNNGTLGGFFVATGAETERPSGATIGGTKAMVFDGSDFLRLATTADGTELINAPAGIVGESPTRSIEVWTLNPEVAGEETLVSWGKRGGPDGSNVSFGYGSDFRWGAMGHWGGDGPDLGWNNDGGNPAPNKWHHLVYTFDGAISRVFADGVLANAELVREGIINTHPDTSINIATQLEADGSTPTTGLRYTGSIAKVRIHDDVLTPAQILANYNTEKAAFIDPSVVVNPVVPASPSKGPIHRYSFNEPASDNATDKEIKDSVGTAHGKVLGDGAGFSGSRLVLAGGPSATAAYADLPNGLISKNSTNNGGPGGVTIETWMKVTGPRTWSRVFDFGSSQSETDNEVTGPGGGGTGLDYLTLSAQIGDDTGSRRLEIRNEDPAGGGVVTADSGTRTFGQDFQVAVTWVESTGQLTVYENGLAISSARTDDPMSDLKDVNVWLGRSNWNGDANTQGEYDEFRIYNYAMAPGEVLGSAQGGPDWVTGAPHIEVSITTPPANQTVVEGTPATFSVSAKGTPPLTYQWARNGTDIAGATGNSHTIPVVSSSDVGATYTVKVSNGSGATAKTVTSSPASVSLAVDNVSLQHRYSFNETSGTTVNDSVGGKHGKVSDGGSFAGGQLTLDGNGAFVDLPNGIISALGDNGTIEAWFTYDGGGNWARLFDFGTQADGENGSGNGEDYITYTVKTAQGFGRLYANFPTVGDTTVVSAPGSTPVGEEVHLAITYNSVANMTRIYTNGVLVATSTAARKLSQLTTDVNNWLGKSQFPADAYFAGKFNEFRIYKGALAANQVAASFTAGPNGLPAIQVDPIKIIASRAGANISITWTGGSGPFRVQTAPAITGPWTTTSSGTARTASVPATGAAGFIRIAEGPGN